MKLNAAIRDVASFLSDKIGCDSFTSLRKEQLKGSEVDKIRLCVVTMFRPWNRDCGQVYSNATVRRSGAFKSDVYHKHATFPDAHGHTTLSRLSSSSSSTAFHKLRSRSGVETTRIARRIRCWLILKIGECMGIIGRWSGT